MNQRLKGELLLKKAFRAPSPSLNYPHNALLILYPPSLHRTLFISFTAFHIRATQCYVHSTQCVHILISDQPHCFSFFPSFPLNPSSTPTLSFIFFKTHCPLPSYLPRSPSLSPPSSVLLRFPPLYFAPFPPPFFNPF